MIYLRNAWASAGLATPDTVAVWALGPPWVAAQVLEEMALLFPSASVSMVSHEAESVLVARGQDLAVLASDSGEFETRRQLHWLNCQRGRVEHAYALYTLVPRHFEVIPVGSARGWARSRRMTNFLLRWRRRWSGPWRQVGSVCARSS